MSARPRPRRAATASQRFERQPARRPKRIVTGYGFWIFLLSDFVIFASLFATFGVLVHNTAGGPTTHDLFDLKGGGIETAALLLSSFACGMASIAAARRQAFAFHLSMLITAVFGAVFLGFELNEFHDFVAAGAGPQRSGSCRRSSRWSAATGCM